MKQPAKIILQFETIFPIAASIDEFAIYNNLSRSDQINLFLKNVIERELENHPDLYELYVKHSHFKPVIRRGKIYRLKEKEQCLPTIPMKSSLKLINS